MQTTGSHHIFDSDQTQFRTALVTQASESANLTVGGVSAGPVKGFISTVRLLSLQDLDYRVEFYARRVSATRGSSASAYANPSQLLGYVNCLGSLTALPANWTGFGTTTATGYGTLFAYFLGGLSIPYMDRDGLGELHCNLLNLDGTAKLPGDTGIVHLTVGVIAAS